MSIEAAVAQIAHRTVKLPPFGTPVPHLGGTFWALMRAKPGSGQDDYPIIVPHGPEFEITCTWGGAGKDEPGAACMWDGQANTRALVESQHDHPAAQFCHDAEHAGFNDFYLMSLREAKALFAMGCDAFDPKKVYHTSTQFARSGAYTQDFGNGVTLINGKSWEGWSARLVRRSSIESLID